MARNDAVAGATLSDLAASCGATLDGDGAVRITRVATLDGAEAGSIAFLANPKYVAQLDGTRASAVIVTPEQARRTALPKLVTPTPYLVYARVATRLHPSPAPATGVHPTAVVDPTATLGRGVSVGPHATIGEGASLGDGVVIGPGAALGRHVRVGTNSRLDAHVVVYDGCLLGDEVLVYAGAVIGADGFGLAEDGGRWLRVPQVGRVVVGDRVEIGANTTVDRGAIDDTRIESDVKLDNQVHVAHNCVIGEGTAIAGCVGIAGSTRLGKRCRIGGGVGISGHLTIPDDTTLGGATVVMSSLAGPGAYSGSWPVQKYEDWRRTAARLRRIDRLADRIAALERTLRRLQADER